MSIWEAVNIKPRGGRSTYGGGGSGNVKRWTPKEDALLRKWYGKKPIRWMIKTLKRSKAAIHTRAGKFGLHAYSVGGRNRARIHQVPPAHP